MIVLASSVTVTDLVGRPPRGSISRILSSCQAPTRAKFVNLWLEAQTIPDDEDPGCMAAKPHMEEYVSEVEEIEDAERAIVKLQPAGTSNVVTSGEQSSGFQ